MRLLNLDSANPHPHSFLRFLTFHYPRLKHLEMLVVTKVCYNLLQSHGPQAANPENQQGQEDSRSLVH